MILTGTVNLWGSPAFQAPGEGDYHIGRTSAAIDHGLDTGILEDLDGDPRPTGHAVDIGADEFTASLRVRKQAFPDPVTAGASLTYALGMTNTGFVTLTATIVDILPEEVDPNAVLTWTAVVPPGALWTATIAVTTQPSMVGVS